MFVCVHECIACMMMINMNESGLPVEACVYLVNAGETPLLLLTSKDLDSN